MRTQQSGREKILETKGASSSEPTSRFPCYSFAPIAFRYQAYKQKSPIWRKIDE